MLGGGGGGGGIVFHMIGDGPSPLTPNIHDVSMDMPSGYLSYP